MPDDAEYGLRWSGLERLPKLTPFMHYCWKAKNTLLACYDLNYFMYSELLQVSFQRILLFIIIVLPSSLRPVGRHAKEALSAEGQD